MYSGYVDNIGERNWLITFYTKIVCTYTQFQNVMKMVNFISDLPVLTSQNTFFISTDYYVLPKCGREVFDAFEWFMT